jgi:small multidrug resistance family-3 protein
MLCSYVIFKTYQNEINSPCRYKIFHENRTRIIILLYMSIIRTLSIFILAGICEIGGGYPIWLWLKEGKSPWYGLLGGIILALYSVVATWQTKNFIKVYVTTYGGIFIVLSLLWVYKASSYLPHKYEIIGASIALFKSLYYFVCSRILK